MSVRDLLRPRTAVDLTKRPRRLRTTAAVKDALALRDAAKGAVGFGRLSVPEDKPDLLPVFDSITVEQQDRNLAIRIDLPQKSIEPLLALLAPRSK